MVFTDGCPSAVPTGHREDQLLGVTSGIEKKKNRNEFRDIIRPRYEIHTTHCPVCPIRLEGRDYLNVHNCNNCLGTIVCWMPSRWRNAVLRTATIYIYISINK